MVNPFRRAHLEILYTKNPYCILERDILDISENSFKIHSGYLQRTYREYSLNSLERFSLFARNDLFKELAEISTEKLKRILPGTRSYFRHKNC